MLKVGITGGIGSGKSLVCLVFSKLGVPVYQADEAGKRLMNENADVRIKLSRFFGASIFHADGTVNRKALASIVFNNEEALRQINSVIHPAVKLDYEQWLTTHNHFPYSIKEAAILIESGTYKNMDKNILVYAPEALRIARVVKRDTTDKQAIMARIANQMPDDDKRKICDFTIVNNDIQPILPQILALHQKFVV